MRAEAFKNERAFAVLSENRSARSRGCKKAASESACILFWKKSFLLAKILGSWRKAAHIKVSIPCYKIKVNRSCENTQKK